MSSKARRGRAVAAVALVIFTILASVGPAGAQTADPRNDPNFGPLVQLLNPTTTVAPPPPPPLPPPPPAAPGLPAGSGSGRRIVYCVACQRVWLVEANEAVVDTHLVSGRAGVPRPGTYQVFSRSEHAISGSRKATLRYMVRFAHGRTLAIGFHEIPRDLRGRPLQTEAELGSYRSLGCVRQSVASALILWNFAPLGTKVVVV